MKKLSILLILVFVLSCTGCAKNEAKDSTMTYSELKSENHTLDANYKQLKKDYELEKENYKAQQEEYEQLKKDFQQYKEKMKPYEANATN